MANGLYKVLSQGVDGSSFDMALEGLGERSFKVDSLEGRDKAMEIIYQRTREQLGSLDLQGRHQFLLDYYKKINRVIRTLPRNVLVHTVEKEELVSASDPRDAFFKIGLHHFVDNQFRGAWVYHVSYEDVKSYGIKTLDVEIDILMSSLFLNIGRSNANRGN